jgi:hypothetical protein
VIQISINPSTVAKTLGITAGLLLLASIGGQLAKFLLGYDYLKGFVPLFHVDTERNIPTFFSVFLLLFSSLILATITIHSKNEKALHTSSWIILLFGFTFMAYDEAFQVHEKLIEPVRSLLNTDSLGVFYFSWVIPGIAIVAFLTLFFLKFLLHFPTTERFRILAAAALYIGGAIGMELIGGNYAESNNTQNLTYSMITAIEEGLEMTGLIVFIWALLKHCADNHKEINIQFIDKEGRYPTSRGPLKRDITLKDSGQYNPTTTPPNYPDESTPVR